VIELVVFDWDGTLMDSHARIVHAMTAAFSEQAIAAPPPSAIRGIIGLDLHHLEMAAAAAVLGAAVSYGAHTRSRLLDLNPDVVIDALGELPNEIKRLGRAMAH
jgi:phosphoglycolate phosphatase